MGSSALGTKTSVDFFTYRAQVGICTDSKGLDDRPNHRSKNMGYWKIQRSIFVLPFPAR